MRNLKLEKCGYGAYATALFFCEKLCRRMGVDMGPDDVCCAIRDIVINSTFVNLILLKIHPESASCNKTFDFSGEKTRKKQNIKEIGNNFLYLHDKWDLFRN